MGELIRTCDNQDVSMMISSFCYYYDELLYCQSSQVRLEANKSILALLNRIMNSFTRDWFGVRKGDWSFCETFYCIFTNLYV